MALIKKKIKAGQTRTLTAPEPERKAPKSSNVVDLVALLQDSLGKRSAKGTAKTKARTRTAAARKPAARSSTARKAA